MLSHRQLILCALITSIACAATHAAAQTPLETLRSLSADGGMYSNRIASATVVIPTDYTEICIADGQVAFDAKLAGQSTAGGNCAPDDVGWIIERDERSAATWESARMDCLTSGMRLPEPFEWKFSCQNAATFGLNQMIDELEWASNSTTPTENIGGSQGVRTQAFGNGGCAQAVWAAVGNEFGDESSIAYRCVR